MKSLSLIENVQSNVCLTMRKKPKQAYKLRQLQKSKTEWDFDLL